MKALSYILSIVMFGAACGKVKEKEVKLEMLPEGETNAYYPQAATSEEETDTDTDTETETDTATLTTLQKMSVEIEKQRPSGTCYATNGGGSLCAFETPYTVTNAIVTSVQNCAKDNTGATACTGSRKGLDWAFIQEVDGGGMLVNPYGWSNISTPLKVGDKLSFTGTKLRYRYGRGYLINIDETTLVVSTATASELFKLSNQSVNLDDIDVTKLKADNLNRLVHGVFKVSNQTVTVIPATPTADTATWYVINTRAQPQDNGLYIRGSGVVEKGKCYEVKNVPLFWSTTPASPTTGGYTLLDIQTFDVLNATNGSGSITAVDCTKAGF